MTEVLAAASEADATSWPDVIGLGLVLLFCFGWLWLMLR